MGEIVTLFDAVKKPTPNLSEAAVLGAIRHLDRAALTVILEAARDPGSPVQAPLQRCGGPGEIADILRSGSRKWRRLRLAWRNLASLLDRRAPEDDFVAEERKEGMIRDVIDGALQGRSRHGRSVFPLSEDERARAIAARAAMDVAARTRLEAAAEQARAREAAARAAAEAERARQQAEATEIVAGIMTLKGVARFRRASALSSAALEAGGTRAQKLAFALLDPALVEGARRWTEAREEAAAASRIRAAEQRALRLAEAGRAADPPASAHLEIVRIEDGFTVRFDPRPSLSLGSSARAEEACYRVRSRLAKARPVEREGGGGAAVSARFGWQGVEALRRAVEDIDRDLDALAREPLTPQMVEQSLGISAAERLRWTKDGRLATSGTGSFRKWGKVIEFALHPVEAVAALRADRSVVDAWREADGEASRARRREGAGRAAETRRANETVRRDARRDLDEMARGIALAVGTPSAVPVVKLAIMATMCSRWAKLHQERGDIACKAAFYALKDRALRILVQQPWTRVRYAPAEDAKLDVVFCEDHRDAFRDARRWDGRSAQEWAFDNRRRIKACPGCSYREDRDHFALFDVVLSMGESQFSWHVPYPLGRDWLPPRETLERAPAVAGPDGFSRFGRPVDEEEMVAWPAARLRREIGALLDWFDAQNR